MWALFLLIYLAGTPIGFLMGYFSLKASKYPKRYGMVGNLLFPVSGYLDDSLGSRSGNGILMMDMDIPLAIRKNDEERLAKYLALQMLFWPIRIFCLWVTWVIIAVALPIKNTPAFFGKQLLRCKKCIKI